MLVGRATLLGALRWHLPVCPVRQNTRGRDNPQGSQGASSADLLLHTRPVREPDGSSQSWQVGTSASRPSSGTRDCSLGPTQQGLQRRWTVSDPRSVERYTLCSDFVWTHCQI